MSYPAIPLVELEESGERLQGQFADMPASDYHQSLALSNSGLGRLLRSPMHYKHGFGESTPAMQLGTAVHALVLEPHLDLVPAPRQGGPAHEARQAGLGRIPRDAKARLHRPVP